MRLINSCSDLIPRKTYYQAIQALAESTKVKHLHLNHSALEGGLTESDYFQLARSLDANNSLEHLILNSRWKYRKIRN